MGLDIDRKSWISPSLIAVNSDSHQKVSATKCVLGHRETERRIERQMQ